MTGRSRLLVAALAVFALSVGLLVGSGFLSGGIFGGGASADELAAARAEAKAAAADAQQGRDFADSVGPAAIDEALISHTFALVRTADATDEDLALAAARLGAAGATIGSTTALTDEWTAPERGPFRDALADQIATSLPQPPASGDSAQVLAVALAQALSAGGQFDVEGNERADTMWTLLTEAELVVGERTALADMFLLVTPGGEVTYLTNAFNAGTNGTVVAFTGGSPGDAGASSTVTNAASFYGAWAVVGAAIHLSDGETGAYDASDADELLAGRT